MMWLHTALLIATLVAGFAPVLGAQALPPPPPPQTTTASLGEAETPDMLSQLHQLRHAVVRLPVAAGLACLLALRPRRRGTPKRQAPVIQTQIILAIVGAAGLVRYRAKIDDPKDAGVMLSTLAVGLAAGVGVYLLAFFATIFIMAVLWIVESFEPKATQSFELKIKAKDPAALKPLLDKLLTRYRFGFELRATSTEELEYEVKLPLERKTDRMSENIMNLAPENVTAVEWVQAKEKKY